MSEFDGLRKHEKIQHALPGSAALATASCSLTQEMRPNFPKGIIKCLKIYKIKIKIKHALTCT